MTDASTIPCARCGSPVPRAAQFCLTCGTPTSIRSQTAVPGAAGQGVAVAATTGSDAWMPAPVAPPPGIAPRRGASGSPVPSSSPSGPSPADVAVARYGMRVLAYLIDSAIGLAVWTALTALVLRTGRYPVDAQGTLHLAGWAGILFLALGLVYPLVLWFTLAFGGWTVGMLATGLRVVRQSTLGTAGVGHVLVRGLVIAAGIVMIGIGALVVYLSPLWDDARLGRGWHDLAAGTRVVDVRRGRNPLRSDAGAAGVPGAYPPPAAFAPAPAPAVYAQPSPPASASVPPAAAPTAPPASVPAAFVPPVLPPVVAPTAPAAAADDVEATRLTDPGARRLAPDVPPQPLGFRLDSGAFVAVTGRGVIGRDPVSPDGDPAVALIAIDDDSRSLSKTHLEFGLDGAGIWVSDRGSTNGSDLWASDGIKRSLVAGERVTVHPGDTVRIGSRRFVVTGARESAG